MRSAPGYYKNNRAQKKERDLAQRQEAERKLLELQARLVTLQQENARLQRELADERDYNSFLEAAEYAAIG